MPPPNPVTCLLKGTFPASGVPRGGANTKFFRPPEILRRLLRFSFAVTNSSEDEREGLLYTWSPSRNVPAPYTDSLLFETIAYLYCRQE